MTTKSLETNDNDWRKIISFPEDRKKTYYSQNAHPLNFNYWLVMSSRNIFGATLPLRCCFYKTIQIFLCFLELMMTPIFHWSHMFLFLPFPNFCVVQLCRAYLFGLLFGLLWVTSFFYIDSLRYRKYFNICPCGQGFHIHNILCDQKMEKWACIFLCHYPQMNSPLHTL